MNRLSLFVVGGALLVGACGDDSSTSPPSPTAAILEVPADGASAGSGSANTFYNLPWPNDIRRHADGMVDTSQFPSNNPLLDHYKLDADDALDGFGKNQPVFSRVTAPIDPASLPDPESSRDDAAASVYLVDVGDGPDHGKRVPIIVKFHGFGSATIPDNYIVARPYYGFPLVDGETYALVITTRVHDTAGKALVAADGWQQIAAGAAGSTAATAYKPLLDFIAAGGGDTADDIASAAVFTTQHATAILPAIRKGIYTTTAPVASGIAVAAGTGGGSYALYTGMYDAPNIQKGVPPYTHDGNIELDANGAAIVQRTETLRFALTVPVASQARPMPSGGWPVVLYAHGTGGDFESFVDDGTGAALAKAGLATISMDGVLQGTRDPGGNTEIDFFNYLNPLSARDNALQGAADLFSQHRMLASIAPASIGGAELDLSAIYFFGHSQGGVTGPGFVAFEPDLVGSVLSGTAGLLTLALLSKTEPFDVPSLLASIIDDNYRSDNGSTIGGGVDVDTPSIGLLQMWMERADPINYAPLMVMSPPDGEAPRNIFQTEGYVDHYAPNPGIEAFATALGSDIVAETDRMNVEGVTLRGRGILQLPITTPNVNGATSLLAQFKMEAGSDGHFVVFDIPTCRDQAANFLGSLAASSPHVAKVQ